mmetsp:Transcript_37367/g.75394  ORF Transcript_37367/g.75394 Transcript_37367/m.75394 type:complete len:217 (-) Transcript_37367:74-724(-)
MPATASALPGPLVERPADALLATAAARAALLGPAELLHGLGAHRRHKERGKLEALPIACLAEARAVAGLAGLRHPSLPLGQLLHPVLLLALLLLQPLLLLFSLLLQLPLFHFTPLALFFLFGFASHLAALGSPPLLLRLSEPLLPQHLLLFQPPALGVLLRPRRAPSAIAADEVYLVIGGVLLETVRVLWIRNLLPPEAELAEVEGGGSHEAGGAP